MSNLSVGEVIGKPWAPNANPHFRDAPSYLLNCQSVVLATELRFRGLDVEARPWGQLAERLSHNPASAFIDPKTGKEPELFMCKLDVPDGQICLPGHFSLLWDTLADMVCPGERYALGWNWCGQNDGHIVNLICYGPGEMMFADCQVGIVVVRRHELFDDYFRQTVDVDGIMDVGIFQTSGMDISPDFMGVIREAGALDGFNAKLKSMLESRLTIARPEA